MSRSPAFETLLDVADASSVTVEWRMEAAAARWEDEVGAKATAEE